MRPYAHRFLSLKEQCHSSLSALQLMHSAMINDVGRKYSSLCLQRFGCYGQDRYQLHKWGRHRLPLARLPPCGGYWESADPSLDEDQSQDFHSFEKEMMILHRHQEPQSALSAHPCARLCGSLLCLLLSFLGESADFSSPRERILSRTFSSSSSEVRTTSIFCL